MKFAIRTDASDYIGSGHVMRCLVLAQSLRENGHLVSFACRPQSGDLIDYILSLNIDVIRLKSVTTPRSPENNVDYIGWLQRSVQDDADDFLACVKNFDVVITDHYALGREWQNIVREKLACKIIAIDDLVSEHDADLLIDQTFGRQATDYPSVGRVLAGSCYALLNPKFAALREEAYERNSLKVPVRVLVSMGGIDRPNATLSVLRLLSAEPDIVITVLLSPRAPHYTSVTSYCAGVQNIQHIEFVEDMANLMIKNDIAVGAPGVTSWERACLGLPNIVIPLAENQNEIGRKLQENHASIVVKLSELESAFLSAYQKIKSEWLSYYHANLKVCDGLGLYRVTENIEQLFESQVDNYQLVKATELDIEKVFQWQSDPRTRQYSLTPDQPRWEEHLEWMKNKLTKTMDYFYITTDVKAKKKVGAVRLDRLSKGHYLLSIFVDPDSYRKRIAKTTLAMVDKIHPHITIHVTVLVENDASQRLFEKANYQRVGPDKFIRNPIK